MNTALPAEEGGPMSLMGKLKLHKPFRWKDPNATWSSGFCQHGIFEIIGKEGDPKFPESPKCTIRRIATCRKDCEIGEIATYHESILQEYTEPTTLECFRAISEALSRARSVTEGETWQPIDSAPMDGTEVRLLLKSGRMVKASVQTGFMNSEENGCACWVCSDEEDCPESWTDGACWDRNEDDKQSDQPTHWAPLSSRIPSVELGELLKERIVSSLRKINGHSCTCSGCVEEENEAKELIRILVEPSMSASNEGAENSL